MTVLGFGGMFTVYTCMQPLLTQITGFADGAVSPILLVFGVGMILGYVLGGRLADRRLAPALLITLLAPASVMALMGLVLHRRGAMLLFTGLLGVAAFATVAPLQLWVLKKAGSAQSLASSLNIGAFKLGNALGAHTHVAGRHGNCPRHGSAGADLGRCAGTVVRFLRRTCGNCNRTSRAAERRTCSCARIRMRPRFSVLRTPSRVTFSRPPFLCRFPRSPS